MDIDLINTHIDLSHIKPKEIEELFEDPFALRFIPDELAGSGESRFFSIGQTISQRLLFVCYNTDGKKASIIAVRDASEEENIFYTRNYKSFK